MNIVVLCNHGRVRSQALAEYINDYTEHNAWARALSPHFPTPQGRTLTIADLNNADCIINLADEKHHYKIEWLIPCFKGKYIEYNLGEDIWDYPEHPELVEKVKQEWSKIQEKMGEHPEHS